MGIAHVDQALDGETFDIRLGIGLTNARQHGTRRLAHVVGAAQVKNHTAHIGFVSDVLRQDLQRDRMADRRKEFGRLVGRRGPEGLDDRNAEERQKLLGLRFGHHLAPFLNDRLDHAVGGVDRMVRDRDTRRRRLHQVLLVPPVAHQMHEGADRLGRAFEGCDPVLGKEVAGRLDAAPPEPVGQNRGAAMAPDHVDDRLGDLVGIGDRRGAEDRERRVVAFARQERFQGLGIALAGRVADDVDRVRPRPVGGQETVQRLDRLGRKVRKPTAEGLQRIDGHDAGAAAIGDDGQPVAANANAGGERRRRLEHFFQFRDPQEPRPRKGRVIDDVGAGQRAGMAVGGFRAGGRAAGFDDDDRLGTRRGARGRHELLRVSDVLHIKEDRSRCPVGRQIIEQIAEIDVAHIPQRDDMGKADAPFRGPIEHGRDDRPGLGDEGDIAFVGRQMGKARIDAGMGRDQPDAVRPDDPHQMRARRVEHGLMQFVAAFDLAETRRDNHCRAAALLAEFLDDLGNAGRRCRDDRQIRCRRQIGDRTVVQGRADRGLMGIDRHDRPVEARSEEIVGNDRAHGMGPVAGADQGDRLRAEQGVEIADAHEGLACLCDRDVALCPPRRGAILDGKLSAFARRNNDRDQGAALL